MDALDTTTAQTTIPEQSPWPVFEGSEDSLVIIYSDDRTNLGKRYALHPAVGSLTIGRDRENEIFLEGRGTSREHTQLQVRKDGWWAVDLDSCNGTWVNHECVSEYRLKPNDQLKIGSTIFKYLSGPDVEQRYHEIIYLMSILDGLTETHNHRYFADQLEREFARAKRHRRPLALVMLDLDHFKAVNDQYGHLAGDCVLREAALLVRTRIRRDELLARYGGEEFALLLPETNLAGAKELAEQLRVMIAGHRFEFASKAIPLTASLGVAAVDRKMKTAKDLVAAADGKLYEAKNDGRDRVKA